MARVIDVDFNANLARFSSQIDKGVAELNRFQTNADRISRNVKASFGGLAAGLSVAGIAAYGKSVIDAADALNDMSLRTQVSVKDLASLRTISEQSGTSLENVGTAIAKLNLSFSQAQGGNKELNEALKRLGINSGDARKRLFQMADAYANASDKSKVLADIQKVQGKSYAELIPLLSQGGDALREATEASEGFADAMSRLAPNADQFNDNLAQLKTNSAGLAANLLADLMPAVNEIAKAMQAAYEESGLLSALWTGLGGVGTLAFTDELDSLGKKIRDAENDVKDLRAALNDPGVGFMKYGMLSDAELVKRIGDTNAKIADLMRERKAAIDAATAAANSNKPQPDKPSTSTGTKADPLAGILSSTDIAKTREYNTLLGLLNQRFDYGKKSATEYQQALAVLNRRFNVNQPLIDALGTGSFKTSDKTVADFIKEQQESITELEREMAQDASNAAEKLKSRLDSLISDTAIAKTEQFLSDVDLLNQAFFDGKIGAEQYQQAIDNITGSKVQNQVQETKSIFEEMGIVMVSHLEDAISGGKDMSDVLKAMERDIMNLIIRLTVMEPLMNGIKGIFSSTGSSSSSGSGSGFNLGNIFQTAIDWIFSANGNVFQSAGLHAYANTVQSRPFVFPFAKGAAFGVGGEAGPEAIMPLTRMNNGKLGVMAANDGPSVQVIINNNASGTQAAASERTDQNGNRFIEVIIDQIDQKLASNMVQGRGALTNAVQATYALNRSAGSY